MYETLGCLQKHFHINNESLLLLEWHDWSEWSKCSATCGKATRTRLRTCKTTGCEGLASLTEDCTFVECPKGKQRARLKWYRKLLNRFRTRQWQVVWSDYTIAGLLVFSHNRADFGPCDLILAALSKTHPDCGRFPGPDRPAISKVFETKVIQNPE